MSTVTDEHEFFYLGRTELESSPPCGHVAGMAVVDQDGLRVGEVEDVVVDVRDRRPRLLSVVSGGILGLGVTETLVPIEAVTEIGDRLRVTIPAVTDDTEGDAAVPRDDGSPFAEAYAAYGVLPPWGDTAS